MAYTKNVWTDQQVERPRTYTITENQDNTITLQDAFGVATDLGTPVNATNMNHIENGIEYCDTNMVKRTSLSSSTGNTTTPVYVKADGKVEVCSREIPDVSGLTNDVNSIKNTKTVTLTGAVTGSNTINLASSNSISISTTGKSKTIQLTGAVIGSATLNTGNTDTVSISTNADTLKNTIYNNIDIDYSAPVSKATGSNFGFTADKRGLLYIRFTSRDSAGYIQVNGNNVANGSTTGNNGETDSSAQIPLSAGDVVTRSGTASAISTAIFYPTKGA